MKIKVLSLVFLFLGVTSCLKSPADGVQVLEVSKYEKKMTESDVQLVDVRTPEDSVFLFKKSSRWCSSFRSV